MSTTDDKALSFVGQITKAYEAAARADANALSYALECGKYLNLAKENVEETSGKGKWKKWRDSNLKVSEETERLYRRLAQAVSLNQNIYVDCKSIRDAMTQLAKFKIEDGKLVAKPQKSRTSRPAGTGSTATGLPPTETATPPAGLEAELENAAADEIISSIADDVDKLEEVAAASIAKLTPEKVCKALTDAWTADQLRDLNIKLTAHLGSLATQSSPDKSSWRLGSSIEKRAI
jgi:hypothetical protein